MTVTAARPLTAAPVRGTRAPSSASGAAAGAVTASGTRCGSKAAEKSVLEALFDTIGERGERNSARIFGCSDRMVDAIAALQKDSEGTAIALEMIASISMVMVGDAQKATQLIAEKKIKKFAGFPVMKEMCNLAAIFARSPVVQYQDIYDAVCRTIRGLSNAMFRDSQDI